MSAPAPEAKDAASARKILLDSPTAVPAVGFGDIGRAFATIISQSEPRFAVGIFGGWGSGKTTLMKAIKDDLRSDGLVTVEFNAWRFEREPQLLIPLLDTIRAALVQWSERDAGPPEAAGGGAKVRSIAARVGRVVRALATGLSGDVGLPGAVAVHYDFGAALAALSPPGEPQTDAQSLYVAAFHELERAFGDLAESGVTRIVVFVDDLDRCLPGNALDVLESMKLFFDLPGFIFVVGLDEDIVERAIRAKFADADEHGPVPAAGQAAAVTSASQRLSREYIKKIFQVPYSLPAMLPQHLDELLASLYSEADLGGAQLDDLKQRVRPYLKYVAVQRRVNPREVKRFINAYTLQTLIRRDLDPDTVLALQALAFRDEWESLYDAILTDSDLFVDALRRYRGGERDAFGELSPDLAAIPPSLTSYLRSSLAEPLTRHDSLDDYLSSLQSTRSTGSWALEAYKQIGELRQEIETALGQELTNEAARSVATMAADKTAAVSSLLAGSVSAESAAGISAALAQVQAIASSFLVYLLGHPNALGELDRQQLLDLRTAVECARLELRLLRDTSVLQA